MTAEQSEADAAHVRHAKDYHQLLYNAKSPPDSGHRTRGSFRRMGGLWRVPEALESGMVGINTGLISTEDSLLTARTVSGAPTFGRPLR